MLKNTKHIKDPATATRYSKQLTILSNIQMIDLNNNMITEEAFKQMQTLLRLNDNIVIRCDDPLEIQAKEQEKV